jgi:alkylated DNA repair dioxygenase AlkB
METNVFHENGYQVLRNLVDPAPIHLRMQKLCVEQGYDSDGRKSSIIFYKDPVFEKVLEDMLPQIEKITGYQLYKTYSMGRQYKNGDVLTSHRDRHACEITLSVCLAHDESWPLWINDKDERAVRVDLIPGDALMFKGIQHAHWRERNTHGNCSQLFLHYVNKNGPYASYKDDIKKTKSLNFRVFNTEFYLSVQ